MVEAIRSLAREEEFRFRATYPERNNGSPLAEMATRAADIMSERTVPMTKRLHSALEALWLEVEDTQCRGSARGPVLERHRAELPHLWRVIDEVQDAHEEQRVLNGNPNAPEVDGLRITSPPA